MKIENLTETFGAAITDFNVVDASENDFQRIQDLLYDRKVVALKRQDIDRPSFQAFAQRFGSLEPFKLKNYHDPEYPNILVINNLNTGKSVGARKLGNMWHSDSSYLETPLALTFLHAQAVPENEGDTLFVDMVAALGDLPDNLREKILGRVIEHDVRWTYKVKETDLGESISEILARLSKDTGAVRHPPTVTHPVTKRTALYVNPGYSTRIVDASEAESLDLLRSIEEFLTQPSRVFPYRWESHDILIWDNRSVIHCATELSPGANRRMHRIGVTDREFFGNDA